MLKVSDFDERQLRLIAEVLGIDYDQEKGKYRDFLEECASIKMEHPWTQDIDIDGNICYYNCLTKETTYLHPYSQKFRKLFYKSLKTVETFFEDDYEEFELGKVEDSTKNKRRFGLRHLMQAKIKLTDMAKKLRKDKRRKKKVKRDTTNEPKKKKRRKKRDLDPYDYRDALESPRRKNQKKANLNILDKLDKETMKIDEEFLGDDFNFKGLQRMKKNVRMIDYFNRKKEGEMNSNLVYRVLEFNKEYYKQKYSFTWSLTKRAKDDIKLLDKWYKIDPVELAKAIMFLEIPISKYKLYWLGRLYLSLPLPPGYIEIFDDETDRFVYYDTKNHHKLNLRPCYYYVRDLIKQGLKRFMIMSLKRSTTMKNISSGLERNNLDVMSIASMARRKSIDLQQLEEEREKDKVMEFYEGNGRVYRVDMEKIIEYYSKKIHIFDPSIQQCRHFHNNEFDEALYRVLKKRRKRHKKSKVSKEKKEKIFDLERLENNPNLKDNAILEIIRQIGIDYESNPILLGVVTNFVLKVERTNSWSFRIPESGQCFWINNRLKQAQVEYPYIKKLKEYLEDHLEYQREVLKRDVHNKHRLDSLKWFLKCSEFLGESPEQVLAEHQIPYMEKLLKRKIIKNQDSKQTMSMKNLKEKLSGGDLPRKKFSKYKIRRRNSVGHFKKNVQENFLEKLKQKMEDTNNVNKTFKDIYDSRGFLVPANLKPFVERCRRVLTKDRILDLLFYCVFDFEVDLEYKSKEKMKFQRRKNIVEVIFYNYKTRKLDPIDYQIDDELKSIMSYKSNFQYEDDTSDQILDYIKNAKESLEFAKRIEEAEKEMGVDFSSLENVEKFLRLGVRFKNRYGDLLMKKKAQLLRKKYLEERKIKLGQSMEFGEGDEESIDEEDFKNFIRGYQQDLSEKFGDQINNQLDFLRNIKDGSEKNFDDFTGKFISEFEKKRKTRVKMKNKGKIMGMFKGFFKKELEKVRTKIKNRDVEEKRVKLKIKKGKFIKDRNWILDLFSKKNDKYLKDKGYRGSVFTPAKDSGKRNSVNTGSVYTRKFNQADKRKKIKKRFGVDIKGQEQIPYPQRLKRKVNRLKYNKRKVNKFLEKYNRKAEVRPQRVKQRAKTPDRRRDRLQMDTSLMNTGTKNKLDTKVNQSFDLNSSSESQKSFMRMFSVETIESFEPETKVLGDLSSYQDSISEEIPDSIFHSKSRQRSKRVDDKKLNKTMKVLLSKFRLEKKTVRERKFRTDFKNEEFIHRLVNQNKGAFHDGFGDKKEGDMDYSFNLEEIENQVDDFGGKSLEVVDENDEIFQKMHKMATVAVMKNVMNQSHKKIKMNFEGKIKNSAARVKDITTKANIVKKIRKGEKLDESEILKFAKSKEMIKRLVKRKGYDGAKEYMEEKFSAFDNLYMTYLLNLHKKGELTHKNEEDRTKRPVFLDRFDHVNFKSLSVMPGNEDKQYFKKFGKRRNHLKSRKVMRRSYNLPRISNPVEKERSLDGNLKVKKFELDVDDDLDEARVSRMFGLSSYYTSKFLEYIISKILYKNQVKYFLESYGSNRLEQTTLRIEGSGCLIGSEKNPKKMPDIGFSRKDIYQANKDLINRLRIELMSKLRKFFFKKSKKIKVTKKVFITSLKRQINLSMSRFAVNEANRDSSILIFDRQKRVTRGYSLSSVYDYRLSGLQYDRKHSSKLKNKRGNLYRISLNPYKPPKVNLNTASYINLGRKQHSDDHLSHKKNHHHNTNLLKKITNN